MKTTLLFTFLTLFSVNYFSQTTHTFYVTGDIHTPGVYTVADTVVEVGDIVQFVNSYDSGTQWCVEKNGNPVPGYCVTPSLSVGAVIYTYTFQLALDVTNGVDILVRTGMTGLINEFIHFTVVDPATADVNKVSDAKFTVYPNPTIDFLNVDGVNVESVKVFDLNGRMVLSETTNKVDVSALQPGIYTVLVNGEERQRVVVE
ncbi:MAG: hypothetical protein RI883_2429 [Bacteroidota bacterium]|jgi:hypothetical protein